MKRWWALYTSIYTYVCIFFSHLSLYICVWIAAFGVFACKSGFEASAALWIFRFVEVNSLFCCCNAAAVTAVAITAKRFGAPWNINVATVCWTPKLVSTSFVLFLFLFIVNLLFWGPFEQVFFQDFVVDFNDFLWQLWANLWFFFLL